MTFKIIVALAVCAVIFVIGFVIDGLLSNMRLELNSYEICDASVPKEFDGFRIAHVSDFHNSEMGEENERLISLLKDAEPDIIVITGDMIDSRNTDVEIALAFAEMIVEIAPCYYVNGNHESRLREYEDFKRELAQVGVTVLENSTAQIEIAGEKITMLGVIDPGFIKENSSDNEELLMKESLDALKPRMDGFTILLSHRPEYFETYVEYGVNLVFSGHAHGGMIRLPFVGGIFAPAQGLFPKYDAGIFSSDGTHMVVSRGIGKTVVPIRINNNPEVVLLVLKSSSEP